MGKPMGNGYPIAGVATRPELLATFGAATATSIPSAAARRGRGRRAVLETITDDELQKNSLDTGRHLVEELKNAAKSDARVRRRPRRWTLRRRRACPRREVESARRRRAQKVVNLMRERNILIGTAGRMATY